jgi:mannosyl-glycoprotein endo-beta-N-acetylglucosaminidase
VLIGIIILSFIFMNLPNTTFAEGPVSASNVSQYIKLLSDGNIYNEQHDLVGKISTGTILGISDPIGENVPIKISGEQLYLDKSSISLLDSGFVPSYTQARLDEPIQYINKFSVLEIAEVYSDLECTKVMATLNPNQVFDVIQVLDHSYEISIADQLAYVPFSDKIQLVNDSTNKVTSSSVEVTKSVTNEATVASTPEIVAPTPRAFTTSDHYFKATQNNVSVFVSNSGKLTPIGLLINGQEYPRISDYGDWHKISYGGNEAFVWKPATEPSDGKSIKNIAPSNTAKIGYFRASSNLTVYDNTSGGLVPYAYIQSNVDFPYISDWGDWLQVSVGGRIGFVYKPAVKIDFKPTDRYFKPTEDNVTVFDNSSGKLVPVATLAKGQVYPRLSDYGEWHQISFGNSVGYVWEDATEPANGNVIKDLAPAKSGIAGSFTTLSSTSVYDNSSGTLVPYATLKSNVKYSYISDWGDWFQVSIGGRIGFVYKPAVKIDFKPTDKYFKPTENNVIVYDNSSGKLVPVASLIKGQIYPRLSDYGEWHQISLGNNVGYVWEDATQPANGSVIKNLAPAKTAIAGYFKTMSPISVYDNTSGSLVPYASFSSNVKYSYISDWGDWLQISVGGRIGYIYKPAVKVDFKPTDRYFEPTEDNVPVYDNSSGKLVPVASLNKGQVYPMVSQDGDWLKIKFGRGYGYVWKDATKPTSSSLNPSSSLSNKNFLATDSVQVFADTSGQSPFVTILKGVTYPIIELIGADWIKVDVSGRIGYVNKSVVQIGPVYVATHYNYTFQSLVDKQFNLIPQTDKDYRTFVIASALNVNNSSNPTSGIANDSGWRVRGGPSTSYWAIGTLAFGESVNILGTYVDDKNQKWYEISYDRVWVNASKEDTAYYLNPNNFSRDSSSFFQFLVLSETAGASISEINANILVNKGILSNKGKAFLDAANKYHINELYLISHALLETSNGKSQLANGILVNSVNGVAVPPRVVYNMFGIGAVDSDPNRLGAEKAYQMGWFTPEDAIIGGAKFISDSYVNDPDHLQNTLYEMRWNPASPATHQYASDIGWAYKQVFNISRLYDLIDTYTLIFDIPTFNN